MIKIDWQSFLQHYMFFGWYEDYEIRTVEFIPGPGYTGPVPDIVTYSESKWVLTNNWKRRFIPIRKRDD